MTRSFRDAALDPTRWTTHGVWAEEARDVALRRTAPLGRRFFAELLERHRELCADAFFLRWSGQSGDTYLFVDRQARGFVVQYDPDLEYLIVSGADGQNEIGGWFPDPVAEALRYIESTYLCPVAQP